VARFLFVVPPLAGHVNPAAAVARALASRGHDIAWVGPESFLRPVLGPDATIYRTGMRMYRDVRGEGSALTFLNQYVLPLARFVIAAADEAVRAFEPDALVVDQHAPAGALVGFRHGLPWAGLLPSSMALGHHRPADVDVWAKGPLAKYCAEVGLPDIDPLTAMYSPHLQVAFTTTALTGPVELPPHAVLVGPALGDRPDDTPFPRDWLDPERRHVLVTVGTLNTDVAADFYRRAVDALDGERWQGIVVAPDGTLPDVPDHVMAVPRVPMLELMPVLDAVVSHGGMNTVCEAALHGVPLVLAPITLDQPVTAEQVVRAGAGVRVDFDTASPAELRAALESVLGDPSHRDASRRIGDSFRAAGGAAAAAQHLERLAG
jgi:UDP:flavonoid glycosyltransferase YjiC (YdhE family)